MNQDKLRQLLLNIRDSRYPQSLLDDVDKFEKKLAADLDIDTDEAMALLGYLLSHKYALLIREGLVLNPNHPEIQSLLDSGRLD